MATVESKAEFDILSDLEIPAGRIFLGPRGHVWRKEDAWSLYYWSNYLPSACMTAIGKQCQNLDKQQFKIPSQNSFRKKRTNGHPILAIMTFEGTSAVNNEVFPSIKSERNKEC